MESVRRLIIDTIPLLLDENVVGFNPGEGPPILVRTLIDGVRTAGNHELIWDGTDEDGRPLPSGTYLLRLETASEEATRSATLVK